MSAQSCVDGFKPPDAKFKKMYAIWKACHDAGVDPPKEVDKFFEGETPDELGVKVDLTTCTGVKEWHAEMCEGWEIDLTKLDKDIKIIRCYTSY